MTTSVAENEPLIPRWYCYLLLAAAVMTWLLIVIGGTVCVTGSGGGCPDWPGCYGRAVPPLQTASVIEYLHRFAAGVTLPLIVAVAIIGWWRFRSIWWLSRPPIMAIVLILAVSAFGAVAVLRGLPPGLAAVDLGSALAALALLVITTVVAFVQQTNPASPNELSRHSGFTRLTLWTAGAVFIVLVSSVLVAGNGSLTRCLGWPMWRFVAVDVPGWPQTARRLLAGAAGLLIIAEVVQAWLDHRRQSVVLPVAAIAGFLFLAEMIVGALLLAGNINALLRVIYVALAAALWVMLVVLAALARLTSTEPADNASSHHAIRTGM